MMVAQNQGRTGYQQAKVRRSSSGEMALSLPALALVVLLGIPTVAFGKTRPSAAGHPPAVKIEASARIPVAPLGFNAPGPTVSTDRTSVLSLNFLDQDHLLFTFRLGGLLKRLPDCPRDDEDQEIRAVVVEIPSGKVTAQADWRMHDFGHYLWPLNDGRVLVRQRDKLFIAGPSLELQPYLQIDSRLREVQVAADAKLLLVEVDRERHEPEEHRKLIEESEKNGTSPPHEDVELAILRPDTKLMLARSHVRSAVHLALIQDGFVEALPGKKDEYVLQFTPFKGEPRVFGRVASACQPSEVVLSADVLSILICRATVDDHQAVAVNMEGKKLWETPWDGHFIWPNYVYATKTGRFAVGALHMSHALSALDPQNREDVVGQRVQVIDAASGKVQLAVQATPVVGAGQNFALSADGRRFAVLHDGAIETYDLPPVSPPEPPQSASK
jgi:hypothetical protein